MTRTPFGTLADGRAVEKLTIAAGELSVSVLTLGATLQDARLNGVPHSLTVGSETLADYEGEMCYFGVIAGPVANRIANSEAPLDGGVIRVEPNEGTTSLHGGPGGTSTRIWEVVEHGADHVTLRLRLADGDGGYPGNRTMQAAFRVEAPATLQLALTTTTDAPTLVNLTNHSYWQLGGPGTAEQTFTSPADRYVAVREGLIPTGETPSVEGTENDFRAGGPVGQGRYDVCLCLSDERRPLREIARLESGGLVLTMQSTETGLQIYDGIATGALALEAQNWSGAANQTHFPTDVLRPGELREQVTRWTFARPG